jgi:predicted CXXCH cytochrome family protein
MNRPVGLVVMLLLAGLASECIAAPAELAELDQVSSACIACHNGSTGSAAGFCLQLQGDKNPNGHVVSVSYANSTKRNSGLRPAANLPVELVLYEGKITCVTCHGSDPHGSAPLAIANSGSALCRACHLK